MSNWDADHYLRFADERTRPSRDLVARIPLKAPATVVDLGCGPGNSTQVLKTRWPDAQVCGVDNSPEMIETARRDFPDDEWILADLAEWSGDRPFDVVFSNAALQWLPDHAVLVPRLFSLVADGGVLAFQIPSGLYAAVRVHIREISHDPAWSDRMDGPRSMLTMEEPPLYYDALAPIASHVDIWETEYNHVLECPAAIVDWIASTGLRPYLAALHDDSERDRFKSLLLERVTESYPRRVDGRVLYPFRRLFVVAAC